MKTSICATCYNHAPFVAAFVDSVLAQDCTDWELNVVDDCSTDGSFGLLQELAKRDSRIHVVQNDRNRHVCHSGNRSMEMATGDLVTLISCDDLLMPQKVRQDQDFFRAHADVTALYTDSRILRDGNQTEEVIRMPDDFSRFYLLRQQLFGRNSLCVPGLTVRRETLVRIGGYNPMLRMTQDHELHIRILKNGEVARASEPTVCYRRHDGNLSARSAAYFNAMMNEGTYFLAEHYLQGLNRVEDLLATIPECRQYGEPVVEAIPYFMARYAIEHGTDPEVRIGGLQALYRFLSDEANRKLLEERYGFISRDFMMMSETQAFGSLKALAAAEENLSTTLNSVSYRLGLFLTWPLRTVFRHFKPRKWEC